MKAIAIAAILLCAAGTALWAPAQTPQRTKLGHGAMIQGYPCAKGYVWYYANQQLKSCTLAVDFPFGAVTVPAGSILDLTAGGKPALVQMPRNTKLSGFHMQGGSLLGAGEGSTVAFYATGKIREFFLSADQTIDGIPCAHGGLVSSTLHGDPSVVLDEEGHLKGCRLSQDYSQQKKGERYAR